MGNDVYETKKKFHKRDLFLAVYKMSSSMNIVLPTSIII